MRRRLSQEELRLATDIAMMWEQSKFPRARVQVLVSEETDEDGRPVYNVVAEARGRLPRMNLEALAAADAPDAPARADLEGDQGL
jgi:hypothetical protein